VNRGAVVAFLGLPGAGKSTLARALADQSRAVALLEPEEHEWPDFVRHPHPDGAFTRLTWFRTQRVPLYYAAADLRVAGEVAVLDSYYDKWCGGWLGRRGLEWLIDPDDPYMGVAKAMAAADAATLPPADVVVFLEIDEEPWLSQLSARNRGIDRDEAFRRSHFTQTYFLQTADARAAAEGTQVVRFRVGTDSVPAEATAIRHALIEAGTPLT
jgi:adenylate kinase family enzyme